MRTVIIDRLEEGKAVLECVSEAGEVSHRILPLCILPRGAAEGDVLTEAEGTFQIDRKLTEQRRSAVLMKIRNLQGR
ncbi:MAG: DUF3006 domain-containing protein [Oscillospiraceae bacterium]|nr:DUF3006 domain-containing protein [Oscillospiraceae bacterium]